ncbi:MAG TPA: LysE family transporter [Microvirga sp.]|jgi:threonine/homoserine/homoserine lactone efflux protein|nr:LysE family transporter [Microvirga sp.]
MSSLHNPVLLDPVFLKAVALGFCVAAPIGPVGLLCINRSLGGGALLGLVTGLGASTVQVGWILLATAGTAGAVILTAHPRLMEAATLTAVVLLVWMGIRAIRRGGAVPLGEKAGRGLIVCLVAYASGIMVSVANPVTGLLFLTAAPTIAPAGAHLVETRAALAAGTFLGSAVWWTALSGGVAVLRHHLRPGVIRMVNQGAGVLLISLAGMLLTNAVRNGAT